MGLFDKLKGKKAINWENAYKAQPQFYKKPDGEPFGALALTEGTKTILPEVSKLNYEIDSKMITTWKLVLVSTTKDTIIGYLDYSSALKALEPYVLDSKNDSLLIKALSLDEMINLKGGN